MKPLLKDQEATAPEPKAPAEPAAAAEPTTPGESTAAAEPKAPAEPKIEPGALSVSPPLSQGKSGFENLGVFLGKPDDPTPSPTALDRKSETCGTEPDVEVVKEDGTVVRLIVTCRCGERMEIDCSY